MRIWCHKRIVEDVLEISSYSLPREFVDGLFKGLVEADIHRDRYVHRHARRGIESAYSSSYISRYLDEATKLFHDGRYREAGLLVGVAIHMAQDLVVLRGSREWHNLIERDIENVLKSVDRNFVDRCVMLKDTRLYTISPERIVCVAYATTKKTLDMFLEKVRSNEELRIKVEKAVEEVVANQRDSSFQILLASILISLAIMLIILLIT